MVANSALLSFLQQFMRLYAHGMKNRLTPAVTALYMLEENPAADPEHVRHLAEMMMKSHNSALALLTSLDNMADIAPEAPKTLDWPAFLQALAGGMGVTLEIDPPRGELTLDAALWTVIARELIANVRDHGGRKAQLKWRVTANRLRMELVDEGPGLGSMAPEKAVEATRRSETSPGVGLGLSKALFAAVLLEGTLAVSRLPAGTSAVVDAELSG